MAKESPVSQNQRPYKRDEATDDEDEDSQDSNWDDIETDTETDYLCLFCDSSYFSCDSVFQHCSSAHFFDFHSIRKALDLDFYSCFKLINYIRAQVASKRCWTCGLECQSYQDLQNHLHEISNLQDIRHLWNDDKYLEPSMKDDSLLYSFNDYEEGDTDEIDNDEILWELKETGKIPVDYESKEKRGVLVVTLCKESEEKESDTVSNGHLNRSLSKKMVVNGMDSRECASSSDQETKNKHLKAYLPKIRAEDIENVNEDYFGAYGSFGIHREMLSDRVRMDAYGQAILKNPSLLNGAVVMDVGCGTGILSLFAAQAGASKVIAVEASQKMAAVASQIAKDNGLLFKTHDGIQQKGVIEVVEGMVEEIDRSIQIKPQSVDVLVSEWMGYCLLYESMLSSVLYARDQWLKPGGAILPDIATIFVAGFGKGGTSLSFWENVHGFNMSSVGKELVENAAQVPIVDVVDCQDVVTGTAVLKSFDLATMKPDEVDFTSTALLEPKFNAKEDEKKDWKSRIICYGVVLWFETAFTSRFCREMPALLSTSPFTPKTHWSQTILTFQEPIALGYTNGSADSSTAIGTDICPGLKIDLRVSIVRSSEHRSIDISLETSAVGSDGRRRDWPAQLFSVR